ncbi:MAG: hypothetical protein SYC29_05350 [Planctomycetota bacterium]|nr:hypothetical protein [Planctomycetota bacterium]
MKALLVRGRVGMVFWLVVAVALPASEAPGQPSPYVGDMRGALRPDFLRRDLGEMVTALKLDEEQQLLVETMFADYEAAFDEGVAKIRARMAELRPTPEPPNEAQREARRELRDKVRDVLAEARERARDAASEEERRQIMQEYQERIRELREKMIDLAPQRRDPAEDEQLAAEIDRELEAWVHQKKQLKDEFFAGVQAVLHEEQRALWPAFERKLRREKTISRGQLSGESIDLFRILRAIDLPEEVRQQIAPSLGAYDVALDEKLRARNDYTSQSEQTLSEALRSGDQQSALAVVNRRIGMSQAVRDVNLEYAEAIASSLPEEWREVFMNEFNLMAFGRVYRATRGERMFEAAMELEDLDEETREAIQELQQTFLADLAARNEQLRQTIIGHEPSTVRRRFERRAPQAPDAVGARTEDPVQAAYAARREAVDQYIAQLEGMLTDEQLRELPSTRGTGRDLRRGSLGPGRGGSLRDRFDKDGDGRLNETELEALREYLRQRRRGGDDF